tara:strand:+ start:300 stop:419 length:120 start_codon:yes stop_codon:yes gene_type:complete
MKTTTKQKTQQGKFKKAVKACKGKSLTAFRACVSSKLRK